MVTVLLLVQFLIRFCNVVCVGKERIVLKKDFMTFLKRINSNAVWYTRVRFWTFSMSFFFLKYFQKPETVPEKTLATRVCLT